MFDHQAVVVGPHRVRGSRAWGRCELQTLVSRSLCVFPLALRQRNIWLSPTYLYSVIVQNLSFSLSFFFSSLLMSLPLLLKSLCSLDQPLLFFSVLSAAQLYCGLCQGFPQCFYKDQSLFDVVPSAGLMDFWHRTPALWFNPKLFSRIEVTVLSRAFLLLTYRSVYILEVDEDHCSEPL